MRSHKIRSFVSTTGSNTRRRAFSRAVASCFAVSKINVPESHYRGWFSRPQSFLGVALRAGMLVCKVPAADGGVRWRVPSVASSASSRPPVIASPSSSSATRSKATSGRTSASRSEDGRGIPDYSRPGIHDAQRAILRAKRKRGQLVPRSSLTLRVGMTP